MAEFLLAKSVLDSTLVAAVVLRGVTHIRVGISLTGLSLKKWSHQLLNLTSAGFHLNKIREKLGTGQ